MIEDRPAKYDADTDRMSFVTRRKLDTGDDYQDFLVELNTAIPMSYAFKKNSAAWSYHDDKGVWSLELGSDGVIADGGLDKTEMLRNSEYETHGIAMWTVWFPVGLLLLVSKRYAKKHWMSMHVLHALLGFGTLIVTIIFALNVTDWDPMGSLHNMFGSICVILAILGSLSGMVTSGTMRFYNGDKPWSEKERVTRIAMIHRYAGYLMLLVGNVTIGSGIGHYYGDILDGDNRKAFGPLSLITFCVLVAMFEAIYRIRNNYALGQIPSPVPETKGGDCAEFTTQLVDL